MPILSRCSLQHYERLIEMVALLALVLVPDFLGVDISLKDFDSCVRSRRERDVRKDPGWICSIATIRIKTCIPDEKSC